MPVEQNNVLANSFTSWDISVLPPRMTELKKGVVGDDRGQTSAGANPANKKDTVYMCRLAKLDVQKDRPL